MASHFTKIGVLVLLLLAWTGMVANFAKTGEQRTTTVMYNKPRQQEIDANLKQWCPFAAKTCQDESMTFNVRLCQPCRQRFLMLITTGRSASTTLMYMLDSLPGIRMSGENEGILQELYQIIHKLLDSPNFFPNGEQLKTTANGQTSQVKNAWTHNHVPLESFACPAQQMIETINPPPILNDESSAIIGFKTIRLFDEYDNDDDKKIQDLVEFIQQYFPCSRVIVNIRSDTKRQAKSRKKYFLPAGERTPQQLNAWNQRLVTLAKLLGPVQAFVLDSSVWAASPNNNNNNRGISVLNEMVTWLGYNMHCHFKKLLQFNTMGYGHGKAELETVDRQCAMLDV